MQEFSIAVSQLYDAADRMAFSSFPREIFRIAGNLVEFDGAFFAAGKRDAGGGSPIISRGYVYGRDESFVHEYTELAGQDPLLKPVNNGAHSARIYESISLYGDKDLARFDRFVKKHELRQLMLAGDDGPMIASSHWLMLYRRHEKRFVQQDAELLGALWLHLKRAIQLNLRRSLEQSDPSRHGRALALINMNGNIEIADQLFIDSLQREWPSASGSAIPKIAFAYLRVHGSHQGRVLKLTARNHGQFLLCDARPTPITEKLGASEKLVAMQFVDGSNYKQIASKMGTSPNTVRNQISQIYRKLDVHDKVSLARVVRQS